MSFYPILLLSNFVAVSGVFRKFYVVSAHYVLYRWIDNWMAIKTIQKILAGKAKIWKQFNIFLRDVGEKQEIWKKSSKLLAGESVIWKQFKNFWWRGRGTAAKPKKIQKFLVGECEIWKQLKIIGWKSENLKTIQNIY